MHSLKSDEVAAIDGVNIVMGSDKKNRIAELIGRWQLDRSSQTVDVHGFRELTDFCPSCSRGDRTRYFLKVQDGCDYFCTYCTIPFARGRSRSGTIASLVEQAPQCGSRRRKRDCTHRSEHRATSAKIPVSVSSTLVKALDEVDGIERYRISSIEPDLLDDEVIDFVAASRRFMPHFHIPLQSGSDEVLRLMHRHYDTTLYARKIEKIRSVMPDAFIGVDVMVGTRGETAELFEQSRNFITSLDVSRLHVFPYSERPGTVALRIGHVVDKHEKDARVEIMLQLSDKKLRRFTSRFIGTYRPVLLEHPAHGSDVMHGFTDNYLRVEVPRNDKSANCITVVNLESISDDVETVIGKAIAI